MATTLYRIIKYGFQSFWRNGWLSVATIVIMVLALLVLEGLIVFGVLARTAIVTLEDKIDISVYFKSTAPEDDILKLEQALESLAEVKKVEYISRDKALTIFKQKHEGDLTISKALGELGDNPLLASLNVKAKNPEEYSVIASYLENEGLANIIEKVTYGQNKLAIDRLVKIADTFETVGLSLTVVLAIVAALITFNTIRLAIYSNREEIGIMRLVGASNVFINGPYIVVGIIYGLAGAFASLIIAAPVIALASPYIQVFIPEMNLQGYFYSHIVGILGYQLLFGIFLGVVSSSIAIRRYLKI